jgi:hypothetical protein
LFVSESEQCADAPAFAALARNFDCQLNQSIKNIWIVFGDLTKDALKHQLFSASGKIQLELVNITPTPIFARLDGPHDGMLG